MRNGVSAAKKTAWLGVPTTCLPGASCLEKMPLIGSVIALRLCRSIPLQASDVGRASNRPICSVSLSNNVLRLISKAQIQGEDPGILTQVHGRGFLLY